VLLGPCETLRLSDTVGTLREDAEIALAVGLEDDACAVARPDRKPIVPADSETPRRRHTVEVVDRYGSIHAVVSPERHTLAVRRHPRRLKRPRVHLHFPHASLP